MKHTTALSTALLFAFGLTACSVDAPTKEDFDYSFLEATPHAGFANSFGTAPEPADAALNIQFRDSDHGIDAEIEKVTSVPLVIESIDVRTSLPHGMSTWRSVRSTPVLVDLMKLADGGVERLGAGPLASGEYSGIRLVIGQRWVETEDGEEGKLELPGDVLLLEGTFDLDENETRTMLIEFVGLRSLDEEGAGVWSIDPTPTVHFVHSPQGD